MSPHTVAYAGAHLQSLYIIRVFQNCTFSTKKIIATQYVPLQGIYKPDPKAFFSNSTLKGETEGTT